MMNFDLRHSAGMLLAVVLAVMPVSQDRVEITINDSGVSPENLTSSKDGTVFFGSSAKGSIYRAAPGAAQAEVWINAETAGLSNVLGVLADDKTNLLWVCSNLPFGNNASAKGQMALRSFDLKTGEAKGTYPVTGGAINDAAVAADGAVYVSETFGGRILRLKPGAKDMEVWLESQDLRGIDGLAFLADGALYFNNFFNGKLSRVTVKEDGGAGAVVDIKTSVAFRQPDGLRTSPENTLIQIEGQGRLTEVTIKGDEGEVRVIKEGLTRGAGVTLVGSSALVLIERAKAVSVPLRSSR